MNHIVPPHGNRPELADRTLTAVLSLYTKYLHKAKEPNKEAYWVSCFMGNLTKGNHYFFLFFFFNICNHMNIKLNKKDLFVL